MRRKYSNWQNDLNGIKNKIFNQIQILIIDKELVKDHPISILNVSLYFEDPYLKIVEINTNKIKMKIDTGSWVNVMHIDTYYMVREKEPIIDVQTNLKVANGNLLH